MGRDFNPRGPCGPRREEAEKALEGRKYFNPRGPCGPRREEAEKALEGRKYFNPRGPCGPRRASRQEVKAAVEFQSTRPLRAATVEEHGVRAVMLISIHAALAGRDESPGADGGAGRRISIHAALAGRDFVHPAIPAECRQFQSTRPLRAATLRDVRDQGVRHISIHAALAGRDAILSPVKLADF